MMSPQESFAYSYQLSSWQLFQNNYCCLLHTAGICRSSSDYCYCRWNNAISGVIFSRSTNSICSWDPTLPHRWQFSDTELTRRYVILHSMVLMVTPAAGSLLQRLRHSQLRLKGPLSSCEDNGGTRHDGEAYECTAKQNTCNYCNRS